MKNTSGPRTPCTAGTHRPHPGGPPTDHPPGHAAAQEAAVTTLFLAHIGQFNALQRVLLVGLGTPALTLAMAASLPALALLPFLPHGTERAAKLLRAHAAYLRTLMTTSHRQPSPH